MEPPGHALTGHPLATAVTYTVLGVLPLYLVSAQQVQLERDLGFTPSRLSLALFAFFAMAALSGAPMGRVIQKMGARSGLRAAVLMSLVALTLVPANSGGWWHIPLLMGLAGISNATAQVSSNLLLAEHVAGRRQGLSFGVKQAAVPAASLIAGAAVPLVALSIGWRWSFFGAATGALLLLVAAQSVGPVPRLARSRARVGRPLPLLALAVAGACAGAGGNALSLFLVASAVASGVSEAAAGTLLAVGSGLVIAGRILVGWLADRFESSGYRELAALTCLGVAGFSVLATGDDSIALYLIGVMVAMLGGWGWPAVMYYTVVRAYPDAPAAATGVVLSANFAGTIVGPAVVGILASWRGYPVAWAFCGASLTIATLAVLASRQLLQRSVQRSAPEPR